MPTKNRNLKTPLKITVIEPSGRLYGSEFCLLDILDGLGSDRFDWTVILPSGRGFDQLLQDRSIACEYLIPEDLAQMSPLRRIPVYAAILWRLSQLKPDVLYVNQSGSLRIAAVYARILKVPVVCQVQTLEGARGLSTRRKRHDCVQAFICNSEYIAAQTEIDGAKKCVMYQGLPPNRLANAIENNRQRRIPNDLTTFTVGILGRIAVSKGHYVLLEAAKQLAKQSSDCRFVVIGEGLTCQDTADYQNAIEAAGLSSHFEFRGYRTDIRAELQRIDLLAIPSISEPLGRVLFDAAESGVPVVVSDTGGLGELSRRFNIGVSFESGNASALAETILQIQDEYQSVAAAFHNAAKTVFERLPLTSYLSTVERILQNAAAGETSNVVWLGEA